MKLLVGVSTAVGVLGITIGIIIGHFGIDQPSEACSCATPTKTPRASTGPYRNAAVAADATECSNVGKEILKKQGSAVDAAIAAMLCVGVINLHSTGVAGGGMMLIYNRKNASAEVIDFREKAPGSSTEDMFKGRRNEAIYGRILG